MYKQQGKYGDNRGLRPATTQGASDGFRLRTTGGLEVQGREGWRSKREPLQISLESLFSDTSTVLVVLSFFYLLHLFSLFSFLFPPPSSSFFGYSCRMSAPFSGFHSCLPLFLFPSFCNISFVFLFYPVFLALDCFLSQTVFFSWLITGLLHLLNNSFSQSLFLAKLLSSFIPFVFFFAALFFIPHSLSYFLFLFFSSNYRPITSVPIVFRSLSIVFVSFVFPAILSFLR